MVKDTRDTIYYWLEKVGEAYERMQFFSLWPESQVYQEWQSKYDYAMEQIRWMRRLDAFERTASEGSDDVHD